MKRKVSFTAIGLLTVFLATAQSKKQKTPPPPPAPPPPVVVITEPPPAPPPPPKPALPKEYEAFLKRNPGVRDISWSHESVHIYLKNGGKETYGLTNKEEAKKLEEKYGKLPAPPPPPPLPIEQ